MTSYQSVQTKQTSASGQAHIIQNDVEALEVAKEFAEQFKKTAHKMKSQKDSQKPSEVEGCRTEDFKLLLIYF